MADDPTKQPNTPEDPEPRRGDAAGGRGAGRPSGPGRRDAGAGSRDGGGGRRDGGAGRRDGSGGRQSRDGGVRRDAGSRGARPAGANDRARGDRPNDRARGVRSNDGARGERPSDRARGGRPNDRTRDDRSKDRARGDRPRFDGAKSRRDESADDERARKRGGAGRLDASQPFRPPRKPSPRKPELPEERPFIPQEAWRDLRATVPATALDEAVKAVGAAAQAMEEGNLDRATELLTWAKSVAPRSSAIREALGIAHYAAERFSEAHAELLTYRRLSAAHDQNHLLADCARAMGRPEKMREYVDEMIAARVEPARIAEGLLVLAGERAEDGDYEGALAILDRAGLDPVQVQPWHPRLWYFAGDVSEHLGRRDEARDYFEAIIAIDPEFGDAEERLEALG